MTAGQFSRVRRAMAAAASIILCATLLSPVQAYEITQPPYPNSAPEGFPWGNWLPCSPDYRENDCIESIIWQRADGTTASGTFEPLASFDYKTWKVGWATPPAQDNNPSVFSIGAWRFPGLMTPCKDDKIWFNVGGRAGAMQVIGQLGCFQGASSPTQFEERFAVALRSSALKGAVSGLSSTSRAPTVSFKDGEISVITISAAFTYTAWTFKFNEANNQDRAEEGGWSYFTALFWTRNPRLAQYPADMIVGTNGWNGGGRLDWDEQEQALVMQVSAPHFDVDGKLNEGWYEGDIRGRYIKNFYGIEPNKAAGRARLEVVYDNGEMKVATMSAKYDPATDWLTFRAYGFTYSSPKLVLRFEKEPEPTPTLTPTPTPMPTVIAPAKFKTITCVKGASVKKVKALKPVCPKGWKKRS